MKVCILAPEFLPVWGGVGSYIVELTRHLPSNLDIHVVAPARDRLGSTLARTSDYDFDDYFSKNVHVHLISKASDTFLYNAFFQFACLKFVPHLIKDEQIDLIHSHTAQMPDLLLAFRRLKVPTVTTVHTTIRGQRQGISYSGASFLDLEFSEKATVLSYPLLRIAEDIYFSFGRSYLTPSNWMKEQLLRNKPRIKSESVRVVHNAVDTNDFSPKSDEREEKLVLFTGRFIAAKGLRNLVDAIPSVLAQHPDAKFMFIGPGRSAPYEERLRQLRVPHSNFEFKGYLKDKSTLIPYYRSCSIFTAPTLYENLPIRILEAMACGKATVATNVCAIPEIISHQENGILVPPGDVNALAHAIIELLSNVEQRKRLGRNARLTVESKFDWAKNARQTMAVYEHVLLKL